MNVSYIIKAVAKQEALTALASICGQLAWYFRSNSLLLLEGLSLQSSILDGAVNGNGVGSLLRGH